MESETDKITALAEECAEKLGDQEGIAFYMRKAAELPESTIRKVLAETLDDMRRGEQNGKPIKKPGALFNWKIKRSANKSRFRNLKAGKIDK